MKNFIYLFCILPALFSLSNGDDSICNHKLAECMQEKLQSEELIDQWMKCTNEETSIRVDTTDEVVKFACDYQADADHLEQAEKARECVRKYYPEGEYDKVKKECQVILAAEQK